MRTMEKELVEVVRRLNRHNAKLQQKKEHYAEIIGTEIQEQR